MKYRDKLGILLGTALISSLLTTHVNAVDVDVGGGDTKLSIGGFIKVNASWSDFEFGDRLNNTNDLEDDILFPSRIATSGESDGVHFNSDAETARINFKTITDTDVGKITSLLEIDFLSNGGNEILSNSANARVRHAFVSWDYNKTDRILAGQYWSTFFDTRALPEAVDFIGPTSGVIFIRQPQLRWTRTFNGGSSFDLALENPSTSLNDVGSDIDDNTIPDIVARYSGKSGKFDWSIATVGREIAFDDTTTSESAYGIAASLSGKYVFGNGDDIKFQLNGGNLGRYIALIPFFDGNVIDDNIELTSVVGGYVAYRHKWDAKWRSTVLYAFSTADLAEGIADTATETVSNYSINLMYSPYKKLTFGGEYIFANRELANGDSGDLNRLQFTAKYAF